MNIEIGLQNQITEEYKSVGLLKFELLASGIRISPEARIDVEKAKGPIRARSGSSGGLDIKLPLDVYVNVPVNESFVFDSKLLLEKDNGQLVIDHPERGLYPIKLQPVPSYYCLHTSKGTPMLSIGQMCSGDRFCYGMTGAACHFWTGGEQCGYCSIGLNKAAGVGSETTDELLETLAESMNDPLLPAKHVLIGGGTPGGEDMGAKLASKICRAIKKQFDISCYVMICAPLDNESIDLLKDSGADELGMNIEFFSEPAWRIYIPGKHRKIGLKRYLDALDYAVKVFGPINTRSLMVAGLEDSEHTVKGALMLASMGVMPIISPFRPLEGTPLEGKRGFDHNVYWDMYEEVFEGASKFGIPVGPTCVCCQNNTLSLPLPGGQYRLY